MTATKTVMIAGGGTGGHLMPSLAIAEALRARHPGWRIELVGATRGVEARLLSERAFPFHLLPFEPIYRQQWWKNLRWPALAVRLIRLVGELLDREHPDLVLGTGGYASGPVVWAAARRGLPTAILEQDAFPGLVTRWLAPRVREVYLGAPEAAAALKPGPRTRVVLTGSPIVPPSFERQAAARAALHIAPGRAVVVVMGGSQGSLAINRMIAEWLGQGGADGLTLLWAAGTATFLDFRHLHAPPHVQVVAFLDPVADAYSVADLVVCRAGMMTIAAVAAWGVPSLLIPLPTAAADHQTKNAAAMAGAGASVMLGQTGLDSAMLGRTIAELLGDRPRLNRMAAAARQRGRPGAVGEIVAALERLLAS